MLQRSKARMISLLIPLTLWALPLLVLAAESDAKAPEAQASMRRELSSADSSSSKHSPAATSELPTPRPEHD
ncbi:MAG: hypothetical protein RL885_22530 [Planctomycetota bacterium]